MQFEEDALIVDSVEFVTKFVAGEWVASFPMLGTEASSVTASGSIENLELKIMEVMIDAPLLYPRPYFSKELFKSYFACEMSDEYVSLTGLPFGERYEYGGIGQFIHQTLQEKFEYKLFLYGQKFAGQSFGILPSVPMNRELNDMYYAEHAAVIAFIKDGAESPVFQDWLKVALYFNQGSVQELDWATHEVLYVRTLSDRIKALQPICNWSEQDILATEESEVEDIVGKLCSENLSPGDRLICEVMFDDNRAIEKFISERTFDGRHNS